MLDFDPDTCATLSNEVVLDIEQPIYFSWIRILSSQRVYRDTFTVSLTTSQNTISCPDAETYFINEKTVDIACCTNLALVSKVRLKWISERSLCSVHIYRGQSVAIHGTSTSLTGTVRFDAAYFVDGDRSIVSLSSSANRQPIPQALTIELKLERVVFEVIVHLKYLSTVPTTRRTSVSTVRTTRRTSVSTVPTTRRTSASTSSSTRETSVSTPSSTTSTSVETTKDAHTTKTTKKKPGHHVLCSQGSFGKSCQFVCHCKQKLCHKDGRCMERSSCEDGWFALACQYDDLARASKVSNRLLTDNNDSTCYFPPENVISANLTEPFLYTWARVVFSHYVFNLSLSFQESEACEDLRAVAEEKNQFDIFCSNEIVTRYVELTWQGNASICSLYINGGRNVATEGYFGSFPEEDTLENLLKDGTRSGTACLSFSGSEGKTLTFRYQAPQTVTRIIVYTAGNNEQANSFVLQGSFDNNSTLFHYRAVKGPRHLVYWSKTKISTVSNVTFHVVEGHLEVCEIEIYGDCAPPHYYLGCEEICILTCYKHRCNYNGFCYNCRHGQLGTHCMEGS